MARIIITLAAGGPELDVDQAAFNNGFFPGYVYVRDAGGSPTNQLAPFADDMDQVLANSASAPSVRLRAAYVPRLAPTAMRRWRSALARVRAGQGDAKILCAGDSTTAGVGCSGSAYNAGNVLNQGDPRSYPYQLAAVLSGSVPALAGLGVPGHAGNTDVRWSLGAGWGNDGLGAGGNGAYKFSGSTYGTLTFTAGVAADTYDVYYVNSGFPGTMTAQATGGASANVDSSAAPSVGKVTVTAAAVSAANVVTITPTSGVVWIVGVEPSLSTVRRVRLGNAGCGGATTANWITQPNGIEAWGGIGLLKAYAPDVTIISLGLNDPGGESVATYTANMATLVAAAQVSGDVLVIPPIPNAASAPGATTGQSQMVAGFTDACQGLGVPYVDLPGRWSSGDTANVDGYMWNYEHPNERGYADIAQLLAPLLLSA